ncbi:MULTISPECIES: organic hydroperoxide resistance protein [Streptomyces]|uniref:Organic hydroperoxide resistance protein n=1 Tax=Streptomyces katrae TaxID=68223 RepID=A0ABT7GZH0_9ACTN|nr:MULTISPECIES: organic hydroperoxide resistance protein [Streptomyces]AZM89047.1 organic hydroperoxide resistance protein [Streptomyces sp. W1SF4]EFL14976.1 organic hydroperoxide resistance protein [Streptomyces sp. C]MDK9499032.1 organic hydroperoxide resistance protein [Streptomyces katrae]RST03358.1 organic hydroperoxide resistance protein [Streptomyces sp. WAC07149]GLX24066.1 organic hydroperoxide resistance protein [Streptomyces lavendulae subsp. lavendulae]
MSITQTDVAYTAVATAENGRDGRVATNDGQLDVVVNPPKELGGSGAGTNPEQLFAAGYSACFQGALSVAARNENLDVTGSTVTAEVGIGKNDEGFGIIVKLTASIPNVDAATAKDLVEKADQICPYSKATRGNITVELNVA